MHSTLEGNPCLVQAAKDPADSDVLKRKQEKRGLKRTTPCGDGHLKAFSADFVLKAGDGT
jgi:hypothetical protein